MKRICRFILVLPFVLTPLQLFAQQSADGSTPVGQQFDDATDKSQPQFRHYLDLQIGDPYAVNTAINYYTGYSIPSGTRPDNADIWTNRYTKPAYSRTYGLPVFSLAYHNAVFSWMEVGVSTYFSGWGSDIVNQRNNEFLYSVFNWSLYAGADIRFVYVNRPLLQCYSGMGLGVSLFSTRQASNRYTRAAFGGQTTLFGLRVGRQVYWSMELGIGYEGFLQTGIGCRF